MADHAKLKSGIVRTMISRWIGVGLLAFIGPSAFAQMAPDDSAMAEHVARMQLEQTQQSQPIPPAPTVELEMQTPTSSPPSSEFNAPGLTPNMGIVPRTPLDPGSQPEGGGRGPRSGGGDLDHNRGPRDGINRNPDPRYRDRRPRSDDDRWRNPNWRDPRDRVYRPPVIVRPYYPPPVVVAPPPVIVRPYVPPPVYVPPPRSKQPVWSGPVPGAVVWSLFPARVYDSLSYGARQTHEEAYIAALNGPLGVTQSWRWGSVRGEISVIDEGSYGASFCRDVVQTIRFPSFGRTVDSRVCLRPGQPWQIVSY